MRSTDWSSLLFGIFLCLMMIIGGLSEGYPGLAVFGGLMLALILLAIFAGILTHAFEKGMWKVPRFMLIPAAIPLWALATLLFWIGDTEMRLMAVLLAVSYAGLLVTEFLLPQGFGSFTVKLPAIRVEGTVAEELSKRLGIEPPEPKPGEAQVRTITKEFTLRPGEEGSVVEALSQLPGMSREAAEALARQTLGGDPVEGNPATPAEQATTTEFVGRPGDLGTVEEALARLVLGGDGVRIRKSDEEPGERQLAKARELIAAGAYAEALVELASVLGAPGPPEKARLLRGITLVEAGRPQEGLKDLEEIPAVAGAAEAWFARAEALTALGKEAEAREAYEQASAYAIGVPGAGLTANAAALPMALLRLGRPEAAATALESQLTKTAEDPSLLCAQALVDAARGMADAAAQNLRRALPGNPHYVVRAVDDATFGALSGDHVIQALRTRAVEERARLQARLHAAAAGGS